MIKYLTLDEFMLNDARSGYIRFENLRSYVHKGLRSVNGVLCKAVVRANTKSVRRGRSNNLTASGHRRRTGEYRRLDDAMNAPARAHGYDGLLIECVVNEFLPYKLESWGYTRLRSRMAFENLGSPSFWRPVTPPVVKEAEHAVAAG